MQFSVGLMAFGLFLFPPLVLHAHAVYWKQTKLLGGWWVYGIVALFYLPLLALPFTLRRGFLAYKDAESLLTTLNLAGDSFSRYWLGAAFLAAVVAQLALRRRARSKSATRFHLALAIIFAAVGLVCLAAPVPAILLVLLLPGAMLGYNVLRNRLLPRGAQRNLIFTVTAAFLAVLYLTLARRVSMWLEPYIPPVATESTLIFVLVLFFQPLQRRMSAVLQRAFRAEAEQLQRLTAEIQHVARAGNLAELITFSETRIRESFSLSGVRISLHDAQPHEAAHSGNVQRFILRNGPAEIGVLEAYFFGQSLSGETHAALDYLAEQLPAAIDLSRLLDEKLRLERELAERERLALLGQMAASVSHNLRNPLSSIKLLLEIVLENPSLPSSARPDCEKAIAEVDRLNAKLTQLLRYAKPTVRAGSGITATAVDVAAIAAQVVSLLHHEAERRGVSLTLEGAEEKLEAAATEEAVSDVLSNLIVNAIEAVPSGGSVCVRLSRRDAAVVLEVTDDGPGITEYVRPRIFQPFFTTKPSGTGLGLAIVEKRLAEIGATIDCESPAPGSARGTRFVVTFRGG